MFDEEGGGGVKPLSLSSGSESFWGEKSERTRNRGKLCLHQYLPVESSLALLFLLESDQYLSSVAHRRKNMYFYTLSLNIRWISKAVIVSRPDS